MILMLRVRARLTEAVDLRGVEKVVLGCSGAETFPIWLTIYPGNRRFWFVTGQIFWFSNVRPIDPCLFQHSVNRLPKKL
ncbi:hypothetical protein CDV49_09675 [Haematobacter genomosp. 1]|uniref:Uncharacterized protein n=1 Tax=Haematobacter genomosp. 1 TaxID=366618 RepID=A0A212ABX2_9RHOB|nr:hypothetical protein CDV49_09675 [Haematobacter genomosp. 1]